MEAGKAELGVTFFLRSAKLGCLEAQVNLGHAYSEGEGGQKDWKAARHWYKNAASRGQPEGAFSLAIEYRNRNNIRLARYWFGRAAAMGDQDADDELLALQNSQV